MYTVLVISCHPDDVEIACAGTLLKCKERGDRVVVCHLCSGDKGHEIIMPKELAEMRAKEAVNGGSLGGFEVMHGGFDDLEIYDNNKESRDKVVNIIRKVNPDFIITHDPEDYMPDHNAVS
ncbi:MAG: PIG-L family deacetylase, partial [Lachnospiraceae bacterium]|nr:PIG-L family deacetylase [Lachnospiraceae bacterium]